MKKRMAVLMVLLCLLVTGCSNEYARAEYNSAAKIASSGDRYSKTKSVFSSVKESYRQTASRFDGRETLWTQHLAEGETVQLKVRLTLAKGQAKLVHVDEEGRITTLLECTAETDKDEYITLSLSMPKGKNKLKLVGYDCKNLTCEFIFPEE